MKKLFLFLSIFIFMLCGQTFSQEVKLPPSPKNNVLIDKEDVKGLSLKSIDNIVIAVKAESVSDVSLNLLCNGAIGGIREYLKSKKINVSEIKFLPDGLKEDKAIEIFNQTYNDIIAKYPKVDREQISYAAVRGTLKKLNDPYALFMDPETYKKMMEDMKGGNFGGVGVYLQVEQKTNYLKIMGVMEDNPAEDAGLKNGDLIIAVDDKKINTKKDAENAHKLLRGEPGSKVTVTVKRGSAEPFNVTMTRAIVRVKTVSSKMLAENLGYIRVSIFGEFTGEEMRNAIDSLESQGALGYILDLRGNAGGYVNAAVSLCSAYLPTGTNIVNIVRKGKPNFPYYSQPNYHVSNPPLAILMDAHSASSSEISAGALQDNKAALIIGSTSYGKGRIQKIVPLEGNCAMKFTTSYYVTPQGREIDKKGIKPDIPVKQSSNKPALNDKDDEVLAEARSVISEQISEMKLNASGDSTSTAIQTRNVDYMLSQIESMCGSDYTITNSTLIWEEGSLYEKITISTPYGERVLFFNRGKFIR